MEQTTRAAHPLTATVDLATNRLAGRRAALWALLGVKLLAGWGTLWDIQWHILIGRDSFWIAPHVLIYAGVTLSALIIWGVLARDTLTAWRGEPGRVRVVTIAGVTGTPGFHLAGAGVVLIVLAAPFDDLWHRLFGIDVTIWSPPHLLGLAGVQVNTLGCLMIARELWPPESRARRAAVLFGGTLFMAGFAIAVYPAGRLAYLYGGVRFFAYPILAAGLYALALVLVTGLTRRRWAPVALALGLILFQFGGGVLSDAGFAILQPPSVVQDVIREDPTSPLGTAYLIAEKNGWRPGASPWHVRAFVLMIPAAAMLLADPLRRWAVSAAVWATTLMLTSGTALALQPAFQHALPGPVDILIALPLVLGSGLLGGWCGESPLKWIDSSRD
jgi:hypothetical protein